MGTLFLLLVCACIIIEIDYFLLFCCLVPFEPKWKIFLNGFMSCIHGSLDPEENDRWFKNSENKQTNKNFKQNSFREVVTSSQIHCVKWQDVFCNFLHYNSGLKLSPKYSIWRQRSSSNQGSGGGGEERGRQNSGKVVGTVRLFLGGPRVAQ